MPSTAFDFELLCELTETSGVPGYEDRIRDLVVDELEATVDRVRTDPMGNVVGTLEGSGDHSVAVAAHMDEIGFMVRHVAGDEDGDGFVELDALGGWDARVLKAQRVTIHTDEGDLPGVIGSPPPHTLDEEEREKTPKVEDVFVDVGLPYEELEERVSPGDLVTMDQTTERVGETVTGKALDDRVCLFAMLEAARRLEKPDATIHFCATVQEEVGLRGAHALGVDVDPDLAIALDVTVANDVPGFDAGEYVTQLGEGTAIKLKDSSVITNPKVHKRMQSVADDAEIDYQLEILPAGGTDTAGFQNTAGAKPVGAISIPTRYLHTVTETAHVDDVAATIDLLEAFLESEDGAHEYTL
ncbi:M42 family metallopeptidase [Natronobacterium gregoryi]|uniref:Cellulase n=2 Tax=Natronobacterium gregoryi TaxID=44930 RepID=L0ADT0_NATGS|nr:M42 family metallopeptidase [Natronobacterium gregoryi]AFZ72063.1 peptidase family protein [Natronobacterium gregoryi SP2]ELY62764.1 cellulase [Natronobacterium gregoryi SP2]PLK20037.1 M42 family peptidase [Natronobacterium gregoryi SP2]SFJ44642.1 endoglucanase [Natronobacterium gregoryi]